MAILPDVLRQDLRLVFCGTAPSRRSAQVGAYYAHGGNLFWKILFEANFTPEQMAPLQYRDLLKLDIGLTDLNKIQSGVDSELDGFAYDPDGLQAKVEAYRPEILAFTSKHGARVFYGRTSIDFGQQARRIGETLVWVLPSTSGSARPHWNRLKHHWYELGRFFRSGS